MALTPRIRIVAPPSTPVRTVASSGAAKTSAPPPIPAMVTPAVHGPGSGMGTLTVEVAAGATAGLAGVGVLSGTVGVATTAAASGSGVLTVLTQPSLAAVSSGSGMLSAVAGTGLAVMLGASGSASGQVATSSPAAQASAGVLSALLAVPVTPAGSSAGILTAATAVQGLATGAGSGTLTPSTAVGAPAPAGGTGVATGAVAVPLGAIAGAGVGALTASVLPIAPVAAGLTGSGALAASTAAAASVGATGSGALTATAKIMWSDNFARANGSLGSNWTGFQLSGQSGVVPVISSNQMYWGTTTTNNTNTQQAALWTAGTTSTDNQHVRATLGAAPNGLLNGFVLRCNVGFTSCVVIDFTSGTATLTSLVSGTWTQRATASYSSWASGDVVEATAIGNVFTLTRNPDTSPVTVLTWTDTGAVTVSGASYRYGGLYGNSDDNLFGFQNWAAPWGNFKLYDN